MHTVRTENRSHITRSLHQKRARLAHGAFARANAAPQPVSGGARRRAMKLWIVGREGLLIAGLKHRHRLALQHEKQ